MRKIIAILLSIILLVSSTYLTLGTHFCGGKAVETKILVGSSHLGCDMMDMDEPYESNEETHHNQIQFNTAPCCQNEYQTIQANDDVLSSSAHLSIDIDLAIIYFLVITDFNSFVKTTFNYYIENHSPPLEKDVQVLFQTFLL